MLLANSCAKQNRPEWAGLRKAFHKVFSPEKVFFKSPFFDEQ